MSGHEEILIVVDDAVVRDLLMDILSVQGFHVRSATKGKQALDLVF